jgi:hypothetical protein
LGSNATKVDALFTANGGTVSGSGLLTLAGGATFDAAAGQFAAMTGGHGILSGTSTLQTGGLALDGNDVLENKGTLTETSGGFIKLGFNPSGTTLGGGTLKNDLGATINFNNTSFDDAVQVGTGTTAFTNAGTVENTGSGTTEIDATFTNTGTVSVTAGELEINGHMAGTGTVSVSSGATFVLNAAASTTANFVDVASGTGTVQLTGGSAGDTFEFGGNFSAADTLNGGGGSNTLILNGDYSSGLTFGANTIANIQTITVDAGHGYNLTLNANNVVTGETLTVNASALGASDSFTFNGSNLTTGTLVVKCGAGGETAIGGAGTNDFVSGLGGDTFTAGAHKNIFIYGSVQDSTSLTFDQVNNYNAKVDLFKLGFVPSAINSAITSGALDTSNFDNNLAAAVNSSTLGAHDAVLFTPSSGNLAGQTFLIVDANGQAGYQAGKDFVIDLGHHPINIASFSLSDFST